jgi:hypothetical protein
MSRAVLVVRICGVLLAAAAAIGFYHISHLIDVPRPPPDNVMDIMQDAVWALVIISVRCLVFGGTLRRRFVAALLLSSLITTAIGVVPPIIWCLSHVVSSDVVMGLFFMFADFVFPCVVLSLALAAVPIFDSRFGVSQAAGGESQSAS